MKKIFYFVLAAVAALCLASCENKDQPKTPSEYTTEVRFYTASPFIENQYDFTVTFYGMTNGATEYTSMSPTFTKQELGGKDQSVIDAYCKAGGQASLLYVYTTTLKLKPGTHKFKMNVKKNSTSFYGTAFTGLEAVKVFTAEDAATYAGPVATCAIPLNVKQTVLDDNLNGSHNELVITLK